jgi:hypothetical protein
MTDQNPTAETADVDGHMHKAATDAPPAPDAPDTEGHGAHLIATDAPPSPDADDVEGHGRGVILERPDSRGGTSSAVQFDREKLAGG